MHLIKLNATDSTSDYLKGLVSSTHQPDFTVVFTNVQNKGRGQTNAKWISEPYKNLTFSFLKYFKDLDNSNQFLISIAVSLAIYDTLKALNVPNLTIKWPNDILSGISKIGGVLVENTISGQHVKYAIIGIGINVNQTKFPKEIKASSIALKLGQEVAVEPLRDRMIQNLKHYLEHPKKLKWQELYPQYEQLLFRKGSVSTFKTLDGTYISGIVTGVTEQGKLQLLLENDQNGEYSLRELKLVY